jgi:short-subunit dehydrogenase
MFLTTSTTAVITGAGSGIGRALALNLAARGVSLALSDIDSSALEETKTRCHGATRVTTHVVDVSDAARVNAFASEVREAHGGANLLINNAGVALHGTFEQLEPKDFDWLMGINFGGVVNGSRAFLPLLRQAPSAYLVNISSVFGMVAPPGQSAYAASKFAVRGFTEALRHELAGSSVRVACVHPGGIQTNIARNARASTSLNLSEADRLAETANMERLFKVTPETAAATILRGLERDQARILIGQDATVIDALTRAMPISAYKALLQLMRIDR